MIKSIVSAIEALNMNWKLYIPFLVGYAIAVVSLCVWYFRMKTEESTYWSLVRPWMFTLTGVFIMMISILLS